MGDGLQLIVEESNNAFKFIPIRDLPVGVIEKELCQHCEKPVSYAVFGQGNPVCVNPECPYHLA